MSHAPIDKAYFRALPADRRIFAEPAADRPYVVLKLATTLDGRIAAATGHSAWITNDISRAFVHRIRAEADAVMVGTNTVLADNPSLTCRLPGLEHLSPIRVVPDRAERLTPELTVIATARAVPTWILTTKDAGDALAGTGITRIDIAAQLGTGLDLRAALKHLRDNGVDSLLVEGGARLAKALLAGHLADKLIWFHAPKVLGGDAVPAIGDLNLRKVTDGPGLTFEQRLVFATDVASIYTVT